MNKMFMSHQYNRRRGTQLQLQFSNHSIILSNHEVINVHQGHIVYNKSTPQKSSGWVVEIPSYFFRYFTDVYFAFG